MATILFVHKCTYTRIVSRQKNYIGDDEDNNNDGDNFSERAIDVPYGSFRRSRRFDDVEMANLGRSFDRRSNSFCLRPTAKQAQELVEPLGHSQTLLGLNQFMVNYSVKVLLWHLAIPT